MGLPTWKKDSKNTKKKLHKLNNICSKNWRENTTWSSSLKRPESHRFMEREHLQKWDVKRGAGILPAGSRGIPAPSSPSSGRHGRQGCRPNRQAGSLPHAL